MITGKEMENLNHSTGHFGIYAQVKEASWDKIAKPLDDARGSLRQCLRRSTALI